MIVNDVEAAFLLQESTDLLVTRSLVAINKTLRLKFIEETISLPIDDFDCLLFYVMVVKSMARHFDYNISCDLPKLLPYRCVNGSEVWSDFLQDGIFVNSGLVLDFMHTMQVENSSEGRPFDVRFACLIFSYAIDNWRVSGLEDNTLDWIRDAKGLTHKSLNQMLEENDDIWM